MKKPTLKEVKEYFKNAEIIEDQDGDSINLSKMSKRGFYFCAGGVMADKDHTDVGVYAWHKNYGYAEIVKYIPRGIPMLEEIKPKHYEVCIVNRKTKESINCDYIDIAKGLGLTNAQFLSLRYFRKKGNLDKQINDAKKGIESYKAHLENLETLKLNNEKTNN